MCVCVCFFFFFFFYNKFHKNVEGDPLLTSFCFSFTFKQPRIPESKIAMQKKEETSLTSSGRRNEMVSVPNARSLFLFVCLVLVFFVRAGPRSLHFQLNTHPHTCTETQRKRSSHRENYRDTRALVRRHLHRVQSVVNSFSLLIFIFFFCEVAFERKEWVTTGLFQRHCKANDKRSDLAENAFSGFAKEGPPCVSVWRIELNGVALAMVGALQNVQHSQLSRSVSRVCILG